MRCCVVNYVLLVFCVMRCCVVYYVLLVFCVVVFCLYVPLVSPAALCADQVTLPELSNHLSHSAATCRVLQLNLKSSNM